MLCLYMMQNAGEASLCLPLTGHWNAMEQKRILIVEEKLDNVMTLCQVLLHSLAGGLQIEVCALWPGWR